MPTDNRTSELVINKLSKQQYENIQNPSPTELYLVPEDEEHKPICYPTTASDVGTTSMLVKSCVSDNGKILTENGFVYNTSGNPTVSDTKVVCDLGAGFMEKKLENLSGATQYYIKSYGQNANGITYGEQIEVPTSSYASKVEYIKSSGTQEINTGIELNNNSRIVIDFIPLTGNANWSGIAGAYNGLDSNAMIIQFNNYASNRQIRTGYDTWATHTIGNVTSRITLDYNKNIVTTSAGYSHIYTARTFYTGNTCRIFNFGGITSRTKLQLYRFKIYDNDVLILDLIPVRDEDYNGFLWDEVNHRSYINIGTGVFDVGPDIT